MTSSAISVLMTSGWSAWKSMELLRLLWRTFSEAG